jgi:hypothetical protein
MGLADIYPPLNEVSSITSGSQKLKTQKKKIQKTKTKTKKTLKEQHTNIRCRVNIFHLSTKKHSHPLKVPRVTGRR